MSSQNSRVVLVWLINVVGHLLRGVIYHLVISRDCSLYISRDIGHLTRCLFSSKHLVFLSGLLLLLQILEKVVKLFLWRDIVFALLLLFL